METILMSILSGLAINIVTWLSGKLGISKTYVSVGLSILLGIIIYVIQIIIQKYPMQWEQIVAFCAGAYGTSQYIYNIYKKIDEQK